MSLEKLGFVHGRFQGLHNEHMDYILAAKKRCEHLLIGISNPDSMHTKESKNDINRSSALANPFTYFERYMMIKKAMIDAGIDLNEFDIIPFPVNYPELIADYVPKKAKFYMTIYDEWSLEKKASFEQLGYSIEVMWTKKPKEKLIAATTIRELIAIDGDWKHLVPKATFDYVYKNSLDKRIKALFADK
ncbi:MAG: adenylyltransferase/cytidyltransferase family protein [Eubacteriales bacterium]|nr:adenylyltransferase/cytidyltransferase family protein [Eubacteriales bacterium]MDY3332871.1 adenylyltransferase/cytidyltransferase family protein [Gallibacter sp.]